MFKGERLKKESILDVKTHHKPTETFQYTHFNSCHSPGVKNGFIESEAVRMLRTNSSKTTLEESLVKFTRRLGTSSYPKTIIERSLSGVNFASRQSALKQKENANERIYLLQLCTNWPQLVISVRCNGCQSWRTISYNMAAAHANCATF